MRAIKFQNAHDEPVDMMTVVLDWVFTFGFGHDHPRTGARLEHRYVVIHGTHDAARAEMVRRFGTKWSHQYASPEEAEVARFGLRPLEGAEAFGALRG